MPQGVPALGPAPPAPPADSHAPALRLLVETKPRGRGPGRMAEASRAAHARLPSTSLLCVTRFLPSRSPQGPRWLLDLRPSLLCSPQEGGEKRMVKGESFRGINCIGHTCSHEGTPSCKGAWKTSLFPGGVTCPKRICGSANKNEREKGLAPQRGGSGSDGLLGGAGQKASPKCRYAMLCYSFYPILSYPSFFFFFATSPF